MRNVHQLKQIHHRNLVVICTADGRIQPIIVPSTAIPWFQPVDIGIKEKYRIQCCRQLELQSKNVMFQNVNKQWRAHLERLLKETIQSNWGPLRIHQGSIVGSVVGKTGVRRVFMSMKILRALQMNSPSGLSNVCLHFGTLRSQTVILTTQYCILYFSLILMSTMNID